MTSGRCTHHHEDTAAPTCQLQSIPANPINTCQLQNIVTVDSCDVWDDVSAKDAVCDNNLGTDWTNQDVAVLSLIFYHWQEAKDIEATKQPLNLKSSALVKMLQSKWNVCRVQLKSGQHMRKVRNRYDFDGRSLLELVSQYRTNPKARFKFLSHLRHMSNEYYASLHEALQPANRDMPMHLYWTKGKTTFRPQQIRRKLFRKAKVDPVQQNPKPPEVKLSLDQQMEAAVNAINK